MEKQYEQSLFRESWVEWMVQIVEDNRDQGRAGTWS